MSTNWPKFQSSIIRESTKFTVVTILPSFSQGLEPYCLQALDNSVFIATWLFRMSSRMTREAHLRLWITLIGRLLKSSLSHSSEAPWSRNYLSAKLMQALSIWTASSGLGETIIKDNVASILQVKKSFLYLCGLSMITKSNKSFHLLLVEVATLCHLHQTTLFTHGETTSSDNLGLPSMSSSHSRPRRQSSSSKKK